MKQLWIPFAQWCAMNPAQRGEVHAWCEANNLELALDMIEPHQRPTERALDHQFEEYRGEARDRHVTNRGFNYGGKS